MRSSKESLYLRVVAAIFFLSGFSALLYQVAWQRILGLFTGSDIRSATIITGAYLAGLGVGSLLGGIVADRLSSRGVIRLFGLCNLGIAGFAFASRFLYYDLLFQKGAGLAQYPSVMLLVVFISLLVPTVLMGLSLPLLSKALVRGLDAAAKQISLLYGVNTIGAGCGALAGGWLLIGQLGYEPSIYVGAVFSTIVGATALFVSRNFSNTDRTDAVHEQTQNSVFDLPPVIWGWCFLVFASGFIFVSLEIIWFRVLGISMNGNAYTFAHLLGLVLLSDALGSIAGIWILNYIRYPRNSFFWLQGMIVLYAIGALWLTRELVNSDTYARYLVEIKGLTTITESLKTSSFWLIYVGLPLLVVVPPGFMVGLYFPIVQKAIQTEQAAVGRRVGITEVANIAGNTLGSILTGLVILDQVGTPGAVRILAALGFTFILVLLWENYRTASPKRMLPATALASALLIVGVLFPGLKNFWQPIHRVASSQRFLISEDSTGVAAIAQDNEETVLFADGEVQGIIPYLNTHSLLGVIPSLVHPAPQNILVIGIGSSATPYGAGTNPQVKRVRAVELIGSELDVLRQFAATDEGMLLKPFFVDPRFEIVIGDGRYELAQSEQKYDIIEADAIRPHRSHAGLLYSREFFEMILEKLEEDGIAFQWAPTLRTRETFISVFPYVVELNEFLIGSRQPIDYTPERLIEQLREPEVVTYLEEAGIDVNTLIETVPSIIAIWTPETPRNPNADINTDLFPKDEYYLNN